MADNEYGLSAFANKTPAKDFIVFNDRRISYGEGGRRVNQLARGLQALGIGEFDKVAILAHNCPEYLEVSQACAMLKAVFVPINYRLRENEVEYVVTDSESKAIFCSADLVGLVNGLKDRFDNISPDSYVVIRDGAEGMVACDEFMAGFPADPPEVKDPHIYGAAMGYTSGTTGLPKGVFRKEPPVGMSIHIIQAFKLMHQDVHLVAGPLYHSAPMAMAQWEMMLGATIVVMEKFRARECLELIQKEKVTTTFMAPILLRYILDLPPAELQKYDVGSMRRIIVAGAPCPFELKQEIINYFGDDVLLEFYGSTDGGLNTILQPEDQLRKPHSIGKPIPEHDIIIVDQNDHPLPPNQTGELLIHNPWLLDSYFNDPEFTANSFHGKYWRSGDMGYVDEDGYYYVVDRCKDMIISGGVNIYPVEIENVILAHPKVFDCCVLGVPDRRYGEAVKAVVQLKEGEAATGEEIIEWVGQRLADYKKPRSLDLAESLPRDMSGKIRKRYLRDQYWAGERKKV